MSSLSWERSSSSWLSLACSRSISLEYFWPVSPRLHSSPAIWGEEGQKSYASWSAYATYLGLTLTLCAFNVACNPVSLSVEGLVNWNTWIILPNSPEIIRNSVIPKVYPSSHCLYCQCTVMWCLGLACIKGFGFSTSSHYLKRFLAAEIKPQLLQKLLPKPLSTNTCELTRLWHPKQTQATQTGLATAT